jgi:hypothetical protein
MINVTEEKALKLGLSVQELCAMVWLTQAAADLIDYPEAVAMGAEELAEWLRLPINVEDS